jgi:hypothetical protein
MPLGGLLPYPDNRRRRLLEDPLSPNSPLGATDSAPRRPADLPAIIVDPFGEQIPTAPTTAKAPDIGILRPPRPGPSLPSLGEPPTAPGMRGAALPPVSALPATDASLARAATVPNLSRYDQLQGAKDVWMLGTEGRGKAGLKGVLRGAAAGLQSGGLAGGLGGALVGGLGGLISPRRIREMEFEERVRPRILERFAYEDADRARQMQQAQAEAAQAMQQAQIDNIRSQIESRRAQDALNQQTANQPILVPEGGTVFDPRTQKPVFTSPRRPDPDDPSLDIEPESGKSADQIAIESYNARGGDAYVLSRLPQRQQDLITGAITDADPSEVSAALRAFEAAKQRQLEMDKAYTRGDVRGRNLRRRLGRQTAPTQTAPTQTTPAPTQRAPQQGASGITRSRSQFNTSKFPGLKFD